MMEKSRNFCEKGHGAAQMAQKQRTTQNDWPNAVHSASATGYYHVLNDNRKTRSYNIALSESTDCCFFFNSKFDRKALAKSIIRSASSA